MILSVSEWPARNSTKKAGIFYTKFRIWDAYCEAFIALRSVCPKWFSADYQPNFSDTRIKMNGKLIPWSMAVAT